MRERSSGLRSTSRTTPAARRRRRGPRRRAVASASPGEALSVPGTATARGGAAAGAVLALLVLGGTPEGGAAQQLPQGVTAEMVSQGRQLFEGDGFCHTCHGRDGSGMQGAGGDLTDGDWRHTDGTFPDLVERIRRGVRANASSTGIPMPPAGGAELAQEEIRAVAAYVWTLSRGGR